jgi:branched-chain amino acid aminotransferase
MKVYISGKLYDRADAKISVFDHGLLYGDGVFEGIRCYNGKIFRLQQHLERLYDSARSIQLEIPLSRQAFADAIYQTLQANRLTEAYIRAVVTRGAGGLGIDPRKCSNPEVIIITDSITLYPKELYDSGLAIITASTIRNHPNAVNPRIKSLNYLNNILAKLEGLQGGVHEVLMLNHKGEVAECSADNIFMAKHGVLRTPPLDAGILGGITRETVIELARAAGIETHESPLTRFDLYAAEEIFLTGTGAEIIGVVKIDGRVVGDGTPGPLTRQLSERYRELVRM